MPLDFSLFDRVPVGIIVVDPSYLIRAWNRCQADWTGIPGPDAIGRDLRVLLPRLAEARYASRIGAIFSGGPPVILSYQLHGDIYPRRGSLSARKERMTTVTALKDGDETCALFAIEDRTDTAMRIRETRAEIARRVAAEAGLRAALAEKELLLREVNHRVKNNLAMISSLVSLQADRLEDPGAVAALRDLRGRLESIVLLYQRLYRLDEEGGVSLDEYLGQVADSLFSAFQAPGSAARLELELESVTLNVDASLSLGLLLAELMANALKYGIGARREGRITVRLSGASGGLELEVEDDGPGYPPGLVPAELGSLGLRLASLVAEEFNGEFTHGSGAGGSGALARLSVPAGEARLSSGGRPQ